MHYKIFYGYFPKKQVSLVGTLNHAYAHKLYALNFVAPILAILKI
jgi:hypothetical protein